MLQQIKSTLKVRGNLVVGRSGQPSAVFNTCLYGVIQEARQHPEIQNIYGMVDGIGGLLKGDLIDLGQQKPAILENLKNTPTPALPFNRDTFVDEDYDLALRICRKYSIRFVIYMGDKEAMSTADRLAAFAEDKGYPLRCIGIPHCVENTLGFTDHCFGYGTAARANVIVTRNVGRAAASMGAMAGVKIVETIGCNSGWLAAATALARDSDDSAPHLIYFPERGLDSSQFLADVESVYRRLGYCIVVLSEGVKGNDGRSLLTDALVHEGVGEYLCKLLAERLQLKASCEKVGDLSRFAIQSASVVDSGEALMAGQAAVRRAVDGMNGFMITVSRHLDPNKPYSSLIGMVRLRLGVQSEKVVPKTFINETDNFVTEIFEKYATPLIGGRLPAVLEPDPTREEMWLEPIPVSPSTGEPEKDIFLP